MSFGLPLRDRILKWQLVSRVDSVSPVRGKKQQNQRTNISNIFECSDERVRWLCQKGGSLHQVSQSSCASGQLSEETSPAYWLVFIEHLLGAWSPLDPSCEEDPILLCLCQTGDCLRWRELVILFSTRTKKVKHGVQ